MPLSDAQINRIKIREWWNERVGAGGPWGQIVNINGKSVDLGLWYEWVSAADPEHGLENCYVSIMRDYGGDGVITRWHQMIDKLYFLDVANVQKQVAAIAAKVGAAAARRRTPARKAAVKKTAKPVKKAARRR